MNNIRKVKRQENMKNKCKDGKELEPQKLPKKALTSKSSVLFKELDQLFCTAYDQRSRDSQTQTLLR